MYLSSSMFRIQHAELRVSTVSCELFDTFAIVKACITLVRQLHESNYHCFGSIDSTLLHIPEQAQSSGQSLRGLCTSHVTRLSLFCRLSSLNENYTFPSFGGWAGEWSSVDFGQRMLLTLLWICEIHDNITNNHLITELSFQQLQPIHRKNKFPCMNSA